MSGAPPGPPGLVTERAAGPPVSLHALLVSAVVGALGAMLGMTQRIAAAYGHDPRLGRPLLLLPDEQRFAAGACALLLVGVGLRLASRAGRRSRAPLLLLAAALLALAAQGPVHHPGRVLEWWPQMRGRAEAAPLLAQARLLGVFLFLACGAGLFVAVRPPRVRRAGTSHGSAAWGRGDELRATREETERLRRGEGLGGTLLLGRHADGRLLVLRESMGHLLTMASTRSGKGVGTVIPNALAYEGSLVVTDPKAEAFFVTAAHRARKLDQRVYALDPFEVTGAGAGEPEGMRAFYNPLRQITTVGPEARLALDRARALVETLILESRGENAFWDRMARQVGTGILLYVCHQFDCAADPAAALAVPTPFGRDLLTLRHLTCLGAEEFDEVLAHMGASAHPEVRRVSNMLLGADFRTRQNIMTSVQAQLAFLDSPQMASVLGELVPAEGRGGSVPNPLPHAELHRIKEPGQRQTVYLVIPPSFLETHAPWLRLMIVALNDVITRTTAPAELPILMMLDEFANLGRMDAVRRGVSLVGGYGVRFWMIVQDLQQVESVYEKAWGTMFANAFVKQLFGTNDLRTAKELSELAGDATVYGDSGSSGRSLDSAGWTSKGSNVGESVSEKGRKLLLPDEVLAMAPERQLLQVRGHRPLYVAKLNYLEMEEVQGLYAPNPMY